MEAAATNKKHEQLSLIIQGLKAQAQFLREETEHLVSPSPEQLANNKEKIQAIEKQLEEYGAKLQLEENLSNDKLSNSGRLERVPLYYADYIQLDKLLACQKRESEKAGKPAHDEMLFIIIHQVYELWFKQILYELDSIVTILDRDYVPERDISRAVHHLERITEIQKVLVDQLTVLETMTALDFMDFRDYLYPASGFQSFQFRLIENRLGMSPENRVQYERKSYHTKLSSEHQKLVQDAEHQCSLFKAVEKWLERTPFLKAEHEDYDFLEHYKRAAERMFEEDNGVILRDTEKSTEERDRELKKLEDNRTSFRDLFDESAHKEKLQGGERRLSWRATQAALLIHIYQDEPIFSLPFRLLQFLIDIDENFTSWRYKHSLMVHRMIGTKLGTGGSSGYWYLKSTIEKGRVFQDIGNLCTYLIPRKDLPALPPSIRKSMGFYAEQK